MGQNIRSTLSSPLLQMALILGASFVANMPCCGNNLIGLDDFTYITALRDLSVSGVMSLFLNYVEGYQPLALLSLGVEYRLWGADPLGYHAVNLALHLADTALVYWLVRLLVKNGSAAFAGALLFGVHPVHVEAVAWVASRKDLLYAFFYFLSAICYVRYAGSGTFRRYGLSVFFIVLSFFSKGMAASIVLTLPAIDFYLGRRLLSWRVMLEKAPFLVLSLFFGVLNVRAQQAGGYVPPFEQMAPLFLRIGYACQGLCLYLWHLLWPVGLSAYYPYPEMSKLVQARMLLSAGAVLALAIGVVFCVRRFRGAAFCILFLGANLALVLQVVPVAGFMMADRYAYVGSAGFCLLAGLLYRHAAERHGGLAASAHGLILLLAAALGVLTFDRCRVWKDGVALWSDVLDKHPNAVFALDERGVEYYEGRRYAEAIRDFDRALEIQPGYWRSNLNRGAARYRARDFAGALADFDRAILMSPESSDAYAGRGLVKNEVGDSRGALDDLNRAVDLGRGKAGLPFVNRSTVKNKMGDYRGAMADATRAIELSPRHSVAYLNRALAREKLQDFRGALDDLDSVLRLDPACEEAKAGCERLLRLLREAPGNSAY